MPGGGVGKDRLLLHEENHDARLVERKDRFRLSTKMMRLIEDAWWGKDRLRQTTKTMMLLTEDAWWGKGQITTTQREL